MKMLSSVILAVIAATSTVLAAPSPSSATSVAAPAFTYDNRTFFLHGEPYQIIGGQMDPQRIPPIYWRDRLAKARAMGLNTIFPYIFWNELEPEPGQWRTDLEANDIAKYFRIAQEEGLNIILRPGSYICGEREYGGFPAWITQLDGMVVRAYNEPFLNATKSYLERLAADVRDLQVTRGGNILMVQVENEYGSYGSDHDYTAAMRDILRENFEVPLYTNDGGVDWTLAGGSVPGVLAEIDGDPRSGFVARDKYITDPSMLGPLLDGEYYTLAPDFWGPDYPHNTTEGRPDIVSTFVSDLDWVLGNNNSISLYMFHGATNFGFSNGAIWRNQTLVFTSSYDYSAPLDESGRTTDLYFTLRETIQKYVPAGSIPEPPANLPRLAIPEITLSPIITLFGTVGEKTTSKDPIVMEALGQAYGFILYEQTVSVSADGFLQPGDRARDRVIIYVNGLKQGVIDSTYRNPANISVSVSPGDKLQLLVENLGRTDYGPGLNEPNKGINGSVKIGDTILAGWDIYTLPVDEAPTPAGTETTDTDAAIPVSSGVPPVFYYGTFTLPLNETNIDTSDADSAAQLDTFISLPAGTKGNIWINDFHLGRYWTVGPQQSLYCPGSILKANGAVNEIVVLELEPGVSGVGATLVAAGLDKRSWGNNPDPDGPPAV